jgi:hypothetical protein
MSQGNVQPVATVLPVLAGVAALTALALGGLYLLDRAAGATVAVLASLV